MILGIGFLLLVSLVLSAVLSALEQRWGQPPFVHTLNFVISFVLTTFLFGMIFKILPDATVRWRDVWVGAAVTSLLFTVGRMLIGLYLGQSSIASTFGAAGSLAIFMVWVFYSSQILLFGASFTRVYAEAYGEKVRPKKGAEFVPEPPPDVAPKPAG
jgi:membrane protein